MSTANPTIEAIRKRINVLDKFIQSAQAEKEALAHSLIHLPSHYMTVEDRWESLKGFILTYLDRLLKIHRVTPNIEVIRIVLEVKYESCSREVMSFEWSLWLPLNETAPIPNYEKVVVTGKHDSLQPTSPDWELVKYLIDTKRLQFVEPR